MAGHSKWSNIQHRKGRQDKKRAKVFSKCSKNIMTAVREGGPDRDGNLRLKYAIEKARASNMPRDNIERAIQSALGDAEGDRYEEIIYEGYGPGGVAVMMEILTDNRNRTAPEIRKIFEKAGREMGTTGCVAHLFNRQAVFEIPGEQADGDRIMEIALEGGAEDVQEAEGGFEVIGSPDAFSSIRQALETAGIEPSSAEVTYVPSMTILVDDVAEARRVLDMMEAFDDHDDVSNVFANFDIPDEVLEQVESDRP